MLKRIFRNEFLRLIPFWGIGLFAAACSVKASAREESSPGSLRRVTFLHTNDEHGWLVPEDDSGGATGIFSHWRKAEAVDHDPNLLLVSSGDLWTGPALSTCFAGESTIDVMNAMGYRAAAIGNHDFDNGVDVLRLRAAQANFPFLSANIKYKESGSTPDFARPYILIPVNGVNVALVGLTTFETPFDTRPEHVSAFDFLSYDDTLRRVVPQVKAEGADVIVVLGHVASSELRALAHTARELGISILFAGHTHEETLETVEEVLLVQSSYFMRGYTRVDLYYDLETDRIVNMSPVFYRNKPGSEDHELKTRVQEWRNRSDKALWQKIGYSSTKISRHSEEMGKLLGKSWLAAYPSAQVTLASYRYIQALLPGNLSPASIISMLPEEVKLLDLTLSGKSLLEIIEIKHPILGGINIADKVKFADGTVLEPDQNYHLVVPDLLFLGCDGYPLAQVALDVRETGLDWRKSVEDWIAKQHTSRWSPLGNLLTNK